MKGFLLCLLAVMITGFAHAQKGMADWKISAAPAGNGVYTLTFHVQLYDGFVTWSLHPGPDKRLVAPRIDVDPATATVVSGISEQGIATDYKLPGVNGPANAYYSEAMFMQQVKGSRGKTVKGSYTYQLHNGKASLPPKTVPFSVKLP
jgi:hypothetical protein